MSKQEQKTKLCLLRDIFRSIREYEIEFQERHDLCLNEGMAICSLKEGKMTSSELADRLGLSASNMSKVLKSVEEKKLVQRMMGEEDRRLMYFELNQLGKQKLEEMRKEETRIDDVLSLIYETNGIATVGIL